MLMGMAKPKEEESEYKVKFDPPQGLVIPDDKKAGDSFEVVAKVKVEKDGQMCLESLNGIALDQEEPEPEEVEVLEGDAVSVGVEVISEGAESTEGNADASTEDSDGESADGDQVDDLTEE